MPLETIEDYIRLGEHLKEIRGPLEGFAEKHGYKLMRSANLENGAWSHYPEMRINKYDRVNRSIQLSMEMDGKGRQFEEFFPEIPYAIFANAWIDDMEKLTRWSGPQFLLSGVPFCELSENLGAHLNMFLELVESITKDYLLVGNRTNKLSPPEE